MTASSAQPALPIRSGKYLIFHLANEEYGMNVRYVREIIGLQEITGVPRTPPQVKGVINLRGKIVPVIDLRIHCSLPPVEYCSRTCIIVLQVNRPAGPMLTGVIVDSVSEVLLLTDEEIEDTPVMNSTQGSDYILGLAKARGKVKILLDIDNLLTRSEAIAVRDMLETEMESEPA